MKNITLLAALAALAPCVALASVPGQIAPRGGYLPLDRQALAAHGKTAVHEARFLPLPERAARQPSHAVAPTAEAPDMSDAPAQAASAPPPKAITQEDAKLLLSIFAPGD